MPEASPDRLQQHAELKQQFSNLQTAYLEHLPGKCVELHEQWLDLIQSAPLQSASLTPLITEVQALVVSSLIFGLKKLSVMSAQLEKTLKSTLLSKSGGADKKSEILFIFKEMQAVIAENNVEPFRITLPIFSHSESLEELIYIVDQDPFLAEYLCLQINCFGYQTQQFGSLSALEQGIDAQAPSAIVAGISLPLSSEDAQIMGRIQTRQVKAPPIIFLSVNLDQTARLNAVRAGGKAFFVKPVDINELISCLDDLTQIHKNPPFKVLFVEDSLSLTAFYSQIMKQEGMECCIVNEPLEVLDNIIDFGPDIIVMDLYLPGWNGYELVAMLRQQEMFVSLPVIFLSTERKLDLQLLALQAGGDDFLTKPINPQNLVASINHRAERYRNLRRHMVEDGLTGLYNHTKTKELLAVELSRAQRAIAPLSFVMLDIDHFKKINDQYGHPVGDRVLKSLAKFLTQSLRRTDVIGRFGGEEFALILPGIEGPQAQIILNNLRQTFSQIQHQTHDAVFNVTFSAGICSYPLFNDVASMCAAADLALYDSKNSGRNRVSLAP